MRTLFSFAFLAMMSGVVNGLESWGTTVDVAGKQRMLSQRMTKEFLLVVSGIDVETNIDKCLASVGAFDSALGKLINGDSVSGIIGAPSVAVLDAFSKVQTLWDIFRPRMDRVHTIRDEDEDARGLLIREIAVECLDVLTHSNAAVGALVDAASAAGVNTATVVVDIAGRQRMLIQRMMKEVLLVSLGIDVRLNVDRMGGTRVLFDSSHKGITMGAAWSGVPALTHACSRLQMNKVYYLWSDFKAQLDVVALQTDPVQMQSAANAQLVQLNENCDRLFPAMVEAVRIIVKADPACDFLEGMTQARWTNLLVSVRELRDYAAKVFSGYTYIANNVDAVANRLRMTGTVYSTKISLQDLSRGSEKKDLSGPLSQSLVSNLISLDTLWTNIEEVLTGTISGEPTTVLTTELVMLQARAFDIELGAISQEYVDMIEANAPSLNAALVSTLSLQTSRFYTMSRAAALVQAGIQVDLNGKDLQSTGTAWIETTAAYLRGSAVYGTTRTNNSCFVRQMWTVNRDFLHFREATDAVSSAHASAQNGVGESNGVDRFRDMIVLANLGYDSMVLAMDAYLDRLDFEAPARLLSPAVGGSGGGSSAYVTDSQGHTHYLGNGCGINDDSFLLTDWFTAITEIARLAALGHSVGISWAVSGATNDSAAVRDIEGLLDSLTYGNPEQSITAPLGQSMLNLWQGCADQEWQDLQTSLSGTEATLVLDGTERFASCVDAALDPYMAATAKFYSVMGTRTLVAVRQRILASKILKTAAMARGSAEAIAVYDDSVALFAQIHSDILHGGGRTPKAIMQQERPELFAQWSRVDAAWEAFKTVTQSLATRQIQHVWNAEARLASLDEELRKFADLYSIADPPAAFVEKSFSWTTVAYVSMAVYVVLIIIGTCYWKRRRYSSNKGTTSGGSSVVVQGSAPKGEADFDGAMTA